MRAYEIQLFKENKWEFDSYINDQGTALAEADRLLNSNRHEGVRVIEEKYDPESNRSDCAVIYSKKRPASRINRGKRSLAAKKQPRRTKKQNPARRRRTGPGKKRVSAKAASRRASRIPTKRKSGVGAVALIVIAMVIVVGGIAALIGLQEVANML